MRAAVKRGTALVVDQVPDPVPARGQVLCRSLACGICGTDPHALLHYRHLVAISRRGGLPISTDPDADMVFGHEYCAEVLDYGPGTEPRLKTGARVVAMPYITGPAGTEFVGYSNRFPGGFGERMVLAADLLLEVPGGVPPEHAAMVEPLAVGAHAVARARLDARAVTMLIGCGPIGFAVLTALKAAGFGPLAVADYSPFRRALAERLGADVVVDPREKSPHDLWSELLGRAVGGSREPVIFECVGRPGVLQSIINGAPRRARVIVVGNCIETDAIEPYVALSKELEFTFCNQYRSGEFAETLRRVADGRIDVDPIVTGVVGLEGVRGAFGALEDAERHAKIVVDPCRQAQGADASS